MSSFGTIRGDTMFSGDHTRRLMALAQSGDEVARDKLVEDNLKLVSSIARRMTFESSSYDDLFQCGAIGLIKAIDKFDLSFGVTLSTYAVPYIIGEMKKYLRNDRNVKVSRTALQIKSAVNEARQRLSNKLKRSPTVSEISLETGIAREEIASAIDGLKHTVSLNATVAPDDAAQATPLLEKITDDKAGLSPDDIIALRQILAQLSTFERRLVYFRFFKHMSQSDTAIKLGCSQPSVSRAEVNVKNLIKKMWTS